MPFSSACEMTGKFNLLKRWQFPAHFLLVHLLRAHGARNDEITPLKIYNNIISLCIKSGKLFSTASEAEQYALACSAVGALSWMEGESGNRGNIFISSPEEEKLQFFMNAELKNSNSHSSKVLLNSGRRDGEENSIDFLAIFFR